MEKRINKKKIVSICPSRVARSQCPSIKKTRQKSKATIQKKTKQQQKKQAHSLRAPDLRAPDLRATELRATDLRGKVR